MPLSFERYRISELFAELLHCSNMGLLNRPPAADRLYDADGRLQGGLAALEELAQVISLNNGSDTPRESMDEPPDDEVGLQPVEGLPIAGHGGHARHGDSEVGSLGTDSDEYMSDEEPGSSDDDAMEEIAMDDEPPMGGVKIDSALLSLSPLALSASPGGGGGGLLAVAGSPSSSGSVHSSGSLSPTNGQELGSSTLSLRSQSRKNSRRATSSTVMEPEAPPPVGERLKKRYIEIDILSTLLVGFQLFSCVLTKSNDEHTYRICSLSFHGTTFCTVRCTTSYTRSSRVTSRAGSTASLPSLFSVTRDSCTGS